MSICIPFSERKGLDRVPNFSEDGYIQKLNPNQADAVRDFSNPTAMYIAQTLYSVAESRDEFMKAEVGYEDADEKRF